MLKKDMFSCNKAAPQFIIYTSPSCMKCEAQKKKWDEEGISYEERDADRIKNHQDEYDREALVEASMNNMSLPVIIKIQRGVEPIHNSSEEVSREMQGFWTNLKHFADRKEAAKRLRMKQDR